MHCYICDADIAEPKFDARYQNYDPCPHCMMIIAEVFSDPVDEDARTDFQDLEEEELDLDNIPW